MSSHSKAAAKFIADAPRTAWHDKALFAVRAKRDRMMHEVPEWEALREASSQIKRHTLSHLAHSSKSSNATPPPTASSSTGLRMPTK